ncbi:methyltransferase-like protein 25B [Ruditapes philippinarum]|uniref:methyltransferase-like protein 25B n=1 Tax=Ruditapes philippinarum TaxID=129788 RepID=UPI00295A6AFA|nr:methyltransferase-like protein 25B [Ruditapes philippinarum]
MIKLSPENLEKVKLYIQQLTTFLHKYTWILDAYVSDFYFKNHWDKLPKSWCTTLSELTTEELSFLLDKRPVKLQKVVPLSLLSFKTCCDSYSLDRQCEDITNKLCKLFNENDTGRFERSDDDNDDIDADVKFNPLDDNGELHAFFKKHVKPKKRHEIKNLAKVVYMLSQHIDCKNVVDVGSGLGHLARLLSFGYNLNVTSVEAAGTHAPKATKYDREIDREIKKKILAAKGKSSEQVPLPCHVTSMIYPNMTAEEFIAIITSQCQENYDTETIRQPFVSNSMNVRDKDSEINRVCAYDVTNKDLALRIDHKNEPDDASCDDLESNNEPVHHEMINRLNECNKRTQDNSQLLEGIKDIKYAKVESQIAQDGCLKLENCSESVTQSNIVTISDTTSKSNFNENEKSKTQSIKCDIKNDHVLSCNSVETTTEGCDSCVNPFDDNDFKSRHNTQLSTGQDYSVACKSEVTGHLDVDNWKFMLTGLHACGDLTPTFLRFFVNCQAAVGLASVGCCYMKISDESCETGMVGYPMSNFCISLPHHQQSYASRELACHFADTYSQRLKESPPLLKIHSYRAALEWIANKLCPDFKRTAVQIPSRKMKDLQFEKYVELGLQKLNIPQDQLTEELFHQAERMTERWKDVVAFYTIRLALAPVVETLVLLDRMMFLFEKGHVSALVPVFDPELSPRNFVLLSWK